MKRLILWSGGLDSTWLLEKFKLSPNVVLSIEIYNSWDNPLRQQCERNAREKIKNLYPQNTYLESSVDLSHSKLSTLDSFNCVFIASQFAASENCSEIWLGANCDDDQQSFLQENFKPDLEQRIKMWNDLIKVGSYRNFITPSLCWPDPAPSRIQQLVNLQDVADLTWSCRNPSSHLTICGVCTPCKFISHAKNNLK